MSRSKIINLIDCLERIITVQKEIDTYTVQLSSNINDASFLDFLVNEIEDLSFSTQYENDRLIELMGEKFFPSIYNFYDLRVILQNIYDIEVRLSEMKNNWATHDDPCSDPALQFELSEELNSLINQFNACYNGDVNESF